MDTIFLSVGNRYSQEYQEFVKALDIRMQSMNLMVKSVGYNVSTHERPMMKVLEVMNESKGAVILAFRRIHVERGVEKDCEMLADISITTPWNHIEAAMAYDRGLPLLVIAEKGLKREGLLEHGYDWYVHEMDLTTDALKEESFSRLVEDWKQALGKKRSKLFEAADLRDMTVATLFSRMRLLHLLGFLTGMITLLFLVFQWGYYIGGSP